MNFEQAEAMAKRQDAMMRAMMQREAERFNTNAAASPANITSLADRVERLARLEDRLRRLAHDFNTVLRPIDGGDIHATPAGDGEVAQAPLSLMQIMDGHQEHLDFYEGVLREQLDRIIQLFGDVNAGDAPTTQR